MSKCKWSSRCGGCVKIDRNINEELTEKTEYIKDVFSYQKNLVADCIGSYYPYKYRNKVHLAFGELKGKTIIGFFEEGSTRIIDVDSCMLFGDWLTTLIATLREYISRFKIRPYDKITGMGIIRYVHARCIDNKLQITLVVTTENFGGRDWLYNKLKSQYSDVSLYININRRTDRAVLDRKCKYVAGSKYLNFDMCGVKVSISPESFLQVNIPIAEKMYKEAIAMLDIKPDTTVVDLYSGIGITSIMMSRSARQVVSIEESVSAVSNAKAMARLNDVHNIIHLAGKCEDVVSKVEVMGDRVVFVDPARAGLEPSVIDTILSLKPRDIVYMSCNPETCVRDVKLLEGGAYRVSSIKPYNMFAFADHVEVLCKLERID